MRSRTLAAVFHVSQNSPSLSIKDFIIKFVSTSHTKSYLERRSFMYISFVYKKWSVMDHTGIRNLINYLFKIYRLEIHRRNQSIGVFRSTLISLGWSVLDSMFLSTKILGVRRSVFHHAIGPLSRTLLKISYILIFFNISKYLYSLLISLINSLTI